jgi:hypothetical protein
MRVTVWTFDVLVAAMVTNELAGCWEDPFEDAPPHPFNTDKLRVLRSSTSNLRRGARLRKNKRAVADSSTTWEICSNQLGWATAAVAEVLIVKVEIAGPLPGVNVGGLKTHEADEGNPEQLKVTAELNPPCEARDIETDVFCPLAILTDDVEAVMVKSGDGRFKVYCAVATALFE